MSDGCLYHVTPARNLAAIAVEGLNPQIGPRSASLGDKERLVYCFTSFEAVENALLNWLGEEFDESERLALLAVNLIPQCHNEYEVGFAVTLRPELLSVVTDDIAVTDFAALIERPSLQISEFMQRDAAQPPAFSV